MVGGVPSGAGAAHQVVELRTRPGIVRQGELDEGDEELGVIRRAVVALAIVLR